MKILFVCTGNTCRSPMAEYYFRSLIEKAGVSDRIETASAGIYADSGMTGSYESFVVLKESYGVDMSRHLSQPLTFELAESADLIVVMTGAHRHAILQRMPDLYPKIKLLMAYAPDHGRTDVTDPYGADIPVYAGCFERMRPALDNLFLDTLSASPLS